MMAESNRGCPPQQNAARGTRTLREGKHVNVSMATAGTNHSIFRGPSLTRHSADELFEIGAFAYVDKGAVDLVDAGALA